MSSWMRFLHSLRSVEMTMNNEHEKAIISITSNAFGCMQKQ